MIVNKSGLFSLAQVSYEGRKDFWYDQFLYHKGCYYPAVYSPQKSDQHSAMSTYDIDRTFLRSISDRYTTSTNVPTRDILKFSVDYVLYM